ncbi:MAG: nicotinate-nucleotide diphosphorylase (carboxylating), partial [Sediminibacterium sp.]
VEKAYNYIQDNKLSLKIEVETRTLDDVKTVCSIGKGKVFRIMLDNFSPDQIKEALNIIDSQYETEASGGINLTTITSYAATGVDFVSVGGLIHQAQSLDLSLKAVITA